VEYEYVWTVLEAIIVELRKKRVTVLSERAASRARPRSASLTAPSTDSVPELVKNVLQCS